MGLLGYHPTKMVDESRVIKNPGNGWVHHLQHPVRAGPARLHCRLTELLISNQFKKWPTHHLSWFLSWSKCSRVPDLLASSLKNYPQSSIFIRGFHKWWYPNSWMVYFMENPKNKQGWWLGVTPMDWKPPIISHCIPIMLVHWLHKCVIFQHFSSCFNPMLHPPNGPRRTTDGVAKCRSRMALKEVSSGMVCAGEMVQRHPFLERMG